MELIGKKIKEERKKRKITQTEMGEKVNACYVTIGQLEKGCNVGTKLLSDVCRELGLELTIKNKDEE